MTKNTRKGRVYFSYMSTSQFIFEGRQGRDLVAETEAETMDEYFLLACPPPHGFLSLLSMTAQCHLSMVGTAHTRMSPPTSVIHALRLAHRCSQIAPAWVKLTKQ